MTFRGNIVRGVLALGGVTLALSGTASANLITNGSFENCGVACPAAGAWTVYASIPGWTTTAGAGIEVQHNTIVTAFDGNNYVELDSHPGPGSNSTMQQSLVGLAAGTYNLSFWYQPRTGVANDNGIAAFMNGNALLPIANTTSPPAVWQQYVYSYYHAGGNLDVKFSAVGFENTLGGFVDDVSLTVPEPASLLLLGAALAGLAARQRRRRAV